MMSRMLAYLRLICIMTLNPQNDLPEDKLRVDRGFYLLLIIVSPVPRTGFGTEQVLSKYLCNERIDCYSHFMKEDLESQEGLALCLKSCGKRASGM